MKKIKVLALLAMVCAVFSFGSEIDFNLTPEQEKTMNKLVNYTKEIQVMGIDLGVCLVKAWNVDAGPTVCKPLEASHTAAINKMDMNKNTAMNIYQTSLDNSLMPLLSAADFNYNGAIQGTLNLKQLEQIAKDLKEIVRD